MEVREEGMEVQEETVHDEMRTIITAHMVSK